MAALIQADRQAIRKLAHRYSMLLQRRIYERVVEGMMVEAGRGLLVTGDTESVRITALAAATDAVNAATVEHLAHT